MIALHRRRDVPIPGVFVGDGRRDLERKLLGNERLLRAGQQEKHSFDRDIWKKAKPFLVEETHGKCAYCEASFEMAAFGDVEHFRPKSVYWWLAYSYDNYLASCQVCNQKFKGGRFPTSGEPMAPPPVDGNASEAALEALVDGLGPDPLDPNAVTDFVEAHHRERPELLDPYIDDPETYFAWKADDALQQVELVARPESEHPAPLVDAVVEAANEIYGLDRPELRRGRYEVYRLLRLLKKVEQEAGLSNELRSKVRAQIERMKSSAGAFAGMVRHFDQTL